MFSSIRPAGFPCSIIATMRRVDFDEGFAGDLQGFAGICREFAKIVVQIEIYQ
jgi:hypothetical protein